MLYYINKQQMLASVSWQDEKDPPELKPRFKSLLESDPDRPSSKMLSRLARSGFDLRFEKVSTQRHFTIHEGLLYMVHDLKSTKGNYLLIDRYELLTETLYKKGSLPRIFPGGLPVAQISAIEFNKKTHLYTVHRGVRGSPAQFGGVRKYTWEQDRPKLSQEFFAKDTPPKGAFTKQKFSLFQPKLFTPLQDGFIVLETTNILWYKRQIIYHDARAQKFFGFPSFSPFRTDVSGIWESRHGLVVAEGDGVYLYSDSQLFYGRIGKNVKLQ